MNPSSDAGVDVVTLTAPPGKMGVNIIDSGIVTSVAPTSVLRSSVGTNDRILEINGKKLDGLTVPQIIVLFTSILNEPKTMTVEKAKAKAPAVVVNDVSTDFPPSIAPLRTDTTAKKSPVINIVNDLTVSSTAAGTVLDLADSDDDSDIELLDYKPTFAKKIKKAVVTPLTNTTTATCSVIYNPTNNKANDTQLKVPTHQLVHSPTPTTQPVSSSLTGNSNTTINNTMMKAADIAKQSKIEEMLRKIAKAEEQPNCSEVEVIEDWKSEEELDRMFAGQKALLSKLPSISIPHEIKTPLLPHQQIGFNWLFYQESGVSVNPLYKESGGKWRSEITKEVQDAPPKPILGGILADEMGLGKSLQVLALILSHFLEENAEPSHKKAKAQLGSNPHTVPKQVISHVKKEHNAALKRHYRKFILGDEEADDDITLGRSEIVRSLIRHLQSDLESLEKYFRIAQIPKQVRKLAYTGEKKKNGVKTTLIVAPLSVFSNWESQIEEHVKPGVLKVERFYGQSRHSMLSRIQSNSIDVLITSYGTLGSEYRNQRNKYGTAASLKRKRSAPISIFDVHFHRIVLDEAHIIRNTDTNHYNSVKQLQATYRVCLTGTPLQNRPQDLYALFSFLRFAPIGRDHTIFDRVIVRPIKHGNTIGIDRLRAMVSHVTCRRKKDTVDIEWKKKEVIQRKVEFVPGSIHERIYNSFFLTTQNAFRACLRGENDMGDFYRVILGALMRIRQACLSGALIPREKWQLAEQVMTNFRAKKDSVSELTPEEGVELFEKLRKVFDMDKGDEDDDEEVSCAVCLQDLTEDSAIILRKCDHVFCEDCIDKVLNNNSLCPLCRNPFKESDVVSMAAASLSSRKESGQTNNDKTKRATSKDAEYEELKRSPKILSLLSAVREMKPDEKGVIFSQFTRFLDVIHDAFADNGFDSVTRIDGTMGPEQRLHAMRSFNRENGGPRFILCSLMAAGTGINLTRGNHSFIMDLWWNRAVEDQAIDRIYRIGQKRDVRVVKFVMTNSVEEKVLLLQEAKAAMGKGVMERLSAAEKKKSLSVFKRLFDIDDDYDDVIE